MRVHGVCRYRTLCITDKLKGVPMYEKYANYREVYQLLDACEFVLNQELKAKLAER